MHSLSALVMPPDVCGAEFRLFVLTEMASRIDCMRTYGRLGRDYLVANSIARLFRCFTTNSFNAPAPPAPQRPKHSSTQAPQHRQQPVALMASHVISPESNANFRVSRRGHHPRLVTTNYLVTYRTEPLKNVAVRMQSMPQGLHRFRGISNA